MGEKSIPSGITMFGITGGHPRWTTIHVPEAILKLPVEEQLAALPELMRAYLVEYGGACPFFGMVEGFVYVRHQEHYRFSKTSQFIEHVQGQFHRGHVEGFLR